MKTEQNQTTTAFIDVTDYTLNDLNLLPQKEVITPYIAENLKVSSAIRAIEKKPELDFKDVMASLIMEKYNLKVSGEMFSRKYNSRSGVMERLFPKIEIASPQLAVITADKTLIAENNLKVPNFDIKQTMEFVPPQDKFNSWILAQLENTAVTEKTIIEWLLKNGYTETQIKPYFKSLN